MEIHGSGKEKSKRRGKTSPGEERSNGTGKVVIAHESVEFCEVTPVGLVDESKDSLYGRETVRDLHSACSCVTRFFLSFSNEQGGGAGWCVARRFFVVLFSLFSRPGVGSATV